MTWHVKIKLSQVKRKISAFFRVLFRIVQRKDFLILMAALPALVIWGFLTYRFIVTPRPAKIREASAKSQYYFEGKNSLYSARIGDKKTNEPKVEFTIPKTDKSVVFYPASARSGLAKPEIEGKQIIFKNVYQDTDYIYQTTAYGIKEDIKINKPNGISTYPFYIEPKNVTPRYFAENLAGGVFYDENKNYLFHFEKPYAFDAKGAKTEKAGITIKKDSQNGKLVAILNIDKDWLAAPERVYPITIDPTIVHDTTAEFAAGNLNRVKDVGSGSSPALETNYQELPADQYTVGLWHMNEGTDNTCTGGVNDVCDKSDNVNDGAFNGNAAFTATSRLGGYATTYDGTGDYINAGNGTSLQIRDKLTMEAWIKTTYTANYGAIIKKDDATNRDYGMETVITSGLVTGTVFIGNVAKTVTSVTKVTDGNWHHVAATYDGSYVSMYVDGKLDGIPTAATGQIDNDTVSVTIGAYANASFPFSGQIDEVRISNTARTPEEIKLSAQRRPYSVYTSDVIDFTSNIISWNPLTWSEHGVATGDGETLKDTTSLVAQWNFNETSGTTASNGAGASSCGGTPANCDGTLTNFASTGSQDAAAGTGWTSANKRWGAGALMFDGSNDKVVIADNDVLSPAQKTVEAWVNMSSLGTNKIIVWKGGEYGLSYNYTGDSVGCTANKFCFSQYNATWTSISSQINSVPGQWYHVVGTYDGTNISLYVNGVFQGQTAKAASTNTTFSMGIGDAGHVTGYNLPGTIDSTRIYSRALGVSEIMSNYQAGNVELLTRVGADTSPDDGSWETWKPTTSETAIDSYDGPYQYNTTDSGLVSYWPMDETVNDSCSGGQDACDVKTTNHGTATGTKIVDGKYGKSRDFNGTSDNVSIANESNFDFSSTVTLEAWFKADSTSARKIISKDDGSTEGYELDLNGWTSGNIECGYFTNNLNYRYEGSPFVVGKWHHAVCVLDSTQGAAADKVKLYLDGVEKTSPTVNSLGTIGSIGLNNYPVTIGTRSGASPVFFDGAIDEARIYNSVLSASTIQQHYLEGTTRPETLHPLTDSTYKIEGSASQKIETGRPLLDGSTVALWHMDETGGTGAYIKDSTANANNGTPTGTALINGVAGKGRSFAGGSNYISTANLNTGTNMTAEAWIKPTSVGVTNGILGERSATTNTWALYGVATGKLQFTLQGTADYVSTATTLLPGVWQHVAVTTAGTALNIYLNGAVFYSTTMAASITNGAANFAIGADSGTATNPFTGSIDEVRVSNVARSAEEIAEAYRAGRDHYINKTISSTDLSAKTSLPFYVAADRPGTYLSATVGESAFANYLPDANTVGQWHLEEAAGTNPYIKDASGLANNMTVNGTVSSTQGYVGKAKYFNDSASNYLSCTDANCGGTTKLDYPGSGGWSVSAWIKRSGTGTGDTIISKHGATGSFGYYLGISSTNFPTFFTSSNGTLTDSLDAVTTLTDTSNWHYLVGVYDGTNKYLYIDGVLNASKAYSTGIFNTGAEFHIGCLNQASCGSWQFNGLVDEARVDNTARTANEIRQAYEVGLRTHPVTIDFGAKLDSGNLITGSSDLGFTVDATYYGLQNKGDQLFKGDKIIVRENYDGTEYIAQGTVTAVTASTGAVTVSAWDSGSTFPSAGFSVNASVFKWQREYWSVNNETLDTHIDAVTNLTIRLTDGAEGRTIWLDDLKSSGGYLTTPGGSTIASSTGNRYFQYRIVNTSFDEAVTATVSAVTVDYVINVAPNTPTLDEPIDTATNQSLTPRLKTTTTDVDSDYIRYKIEMCTNALMTLNCQTFDQTSSQTGWSGQNTQSSTAYTSGTQGVYSVQTPLTALTTYYWRSYAIDPGGINLWSLTQGTPYSFITSNNPLSPSSLLAEGATNPIAVTDTTPEFSAVCNHEGAAMVFNKYRIQVATSGDFASPVWDSGASGTAMTDCLNGTRSQDISYGGTPLALDGTVYYWRIDFWDTAGNESPWSNESSFFKMDSSVMEAPTNCRIQEGVDEASITLLWNDNSSSETQFRIEKNTNSGGFTFLINKIAGSTSHLDSSVSQGNTYQYRVRAEGATNSDWCTTSTVTLQLGTFQFKGLDLKGLNLQ